MGEPAGPPVDTMDTAEEILEFQGHLKLSRILGVVQDELWQSDRSDSNFRCRNIDKATLNP